MNLIYYSITEILTMPHVSAGEIDRRLIYYIFDRMPVLKTAKKQHDDRNPEWIVTLLAAVMENMPSILVSLARRSTRSRIDRLWRLMTAYNDCALFLLQGSPYLRNLSSAERGHYQHMLTAILENARSYCRAFEIVKRGNEAEEIQQVFDNLANSGFLYHPKRQLFLLMALFRLKPELVDGALSNIFKAILYWPLETWNADPFRDAFVEQLQIYVDENRRDIDELLKAENDMDYRLVERMVTAISILRFLYDPEKDKEVLNRNLSLFYRCITLFPKRALSTDTLLTKSTLSLLGMDMLREYGWSDLSDPQRMTVLAQRPPSDALLRQASVPRVYAAPAGNVEITPGCVTLRSREDGAIPLIPDGFTPDDSIQICMADKPFSINNLNNPIPLKNFWARVENSFFPKSAGSRQEKEIKVSSRVARPEIGDKVAVVVTDIEWIDRMPYYNCTVDDEGYEGSGYIPGDQLVDFIARDVTMRTFTNEYGVAMKFKAEVIDCDEDGKFVFSLVRDARMVMSEIAKADGITVYRCVITADNDKSGRRDSRMTGTYSAICDAGFGLFVKKGSDCDLSTGTVLQVRLTQARSGSIYGEIESIEESMRTVSNEAAARAILERLDVNPATCIVAGEEKNVYDSDETAGSVHIGRDAVREIIELLRVRAVVCKSIPQRMNLLRMARLLAMTIADGQLKATIDTHLDLIELQDYYVRNHQVRPEKLDLLRSSVDQLPAGHVRRLFDRLEMISWMDRDDRNDVLWDRSQNALSELDRRIASTILSGKLFGNGRGAEILRESIITGLGTMINADIEEHNLKYYFSETKTQEFKSSFVYPAVKKGARRMVAQLECQLTEIMHTVTGFLNTEGGTLYVGVDDKTKYEKGIEDDWSFFRLNPRYGVKDHDLDSLINFVKCKFRDENRFNHRILEYINIEPDTDTVKEVVKFTITPYPEPVTLDGTIRVRSVNGTDTLTESEARDFIRDRHNVYRNLCRRRHDMGVYSGGDGMDASGNVTEPHELRGYGGVPVRAVEADDNLYVRKSLSKGDEVATTSLRDNHVDPSDVDFVPSDYYMAFTGDHDFVVLKNEWEFTDCDARLKLALRSSETYMVLIYENEEVVSVPMTEFTSKKKGQSWPHYRGSRLLFASPAMADDVLVGILTAPRGGYFWRAVTVRDLPTGSSVTSQPRRIMQTACAGAVVWEIVPAKYAGNYSDRHRPTVIGTRLPSKGTDEASIAEAIKQFFAPCRK